MRNLKTPKWPAGPRRGLCTAVATLLLWPATLSDARSQPAPEDPQALARQVVTNELEAQQNDNTYWMYVSTVQEAGKEQTRHVIETYEGALTLVVAENGQSLTPRQQQQEDERVYGLIHNPAN